MSGERRSRGLPILLVVIILIIPVATWYSLNMARRAQFTEMAGSLAEAVTEFSGKTELVVEAQPRRVRVARSGETATHHLDARRLTMVEGTLRRETWFLLAVRNSKSVEDALFGFEIELDQAKGWVMKTPQVYVRFRDLPDPSLVDLVTGELDRHGLSATVTHQFGPERDK